MKKPFILILGIAAVLTTLCAVGLPLRAVFGWTETAHDFGTIKHNVPVDYEFKFTNKGESPLVVSSVKTPCGCTVADYSKDPIPPGSEGFVKATYKATALGKFSKTITVSSNTEEGTASLTIKGEVVE